MPYAIAIQKPGVSRSILGMTRVFKILRVYDNGETLEEVAAKVNSIAREFDVHADQLVIVYSE